ncbi:MAG: serine/threonine protein kinase, partial [Desulfobacteraceae bacterium]|nr:serine/threonine protein kinase [Desulfobacteraceae bacterium]
DGDETVFFDSGAAMEAEDISTPEIQPSDAEDGDGDETVFFDSEAVLEKGPGGQCVPAAPGGPAVKTIGNYQALKLLGRGGFGSVWKACSPAGRMVAVKELNPEILDNDRAVRKFFHEAIILSRLDHPNICAFIDFFPHEGNYAIVMDFVEGIDLKDMLEEQKGPLPLETAVSIASQTLDAFHYALEKQVLHRDIKPENITVDTNGVAKVMDFGIARLSSSESQQTSLFMISPAYTAPERFDANKADLVDHRSDIYSLGLLFYEIFTGAHPFPVTSPVDMIRAHLSTAPTPPDQVAEIPRKISDGILQALEKDPEDRFPDFASFKMAMLGEPPLRTSKSLGIIEFSGDQCKSSATLFKTLAGLLKKHQKNAAHISIGQGGTKVHLIVETVGGTTIRIQRDIDKP